jgi:hypothetical protein
VWHIARGVRQPRGNCVRCALGQSCIKTGAIPPFGTARLFKATKSAVKTLTSLKFLSLVSRAI